MSGAVGSRKRGCGDGGAALVEFAIIAPFLFLILFGIIEFGWAFSQNLDVRHGAREGSRLAAVNYRPVVANSGSAQVADIINEVCSRIDDPSGTTVALQIPSQAIAPLGSIGDAGQKAIVTITKPLDTLTGFFDAALGSKTLTSSVDVRLEVKTTWSTNNSTHSGTC